jgi:hypothetical protein
MFNDEFSRSGPFHNGGNINEGRTAILKSFEWNFLAAGRYALDGVLPHTQAKGEFHRKIPPKISHPCNRGFGVDQFTLGEIEIISFIPNPDS